MSRGVFLFCFDNGVIPYHKLASLCAWLVKKHLGVDVCVAGDAATLKQLEKHASLFHSMIEVMPPIHMGDRVYATRSNDRSSSGSFLNNNLHTVYTLSPFDETLVIDLDYLVLDSNLNAVWGSEAPVRINRLVGGIHDGYRHHSETHLHELGIPQYWVTVIYFRKSVEAELFFDGIKYVKDRYQYFSKLYRFSNLLYRNDFAASIVAHSMNGGIGEAGDEWPIQSLPEKRLLFAWDEQPLLKMKDDCLWFVAEADPMRPKGTSPVMLKNLSVHVMNKSSVLDIAVPWFDEQWEDQND